MNLPSILILAAVGAGLALAIARLWRGRGRCGGCGGDCARCAARCAQRGRPDAGEK